MNEYQVLNLAIKLAQWDNILAKNFNLPLAQSYIDRAIKLLELASTRSFIRDAENNIP
jgi:hypothetical protein